MRCKKKMDSIIARGLTFYGCHGVLSEEKNNPQPFKVDLELFLDLLEAGNRDDLQYTIDYAQVFSIVKKIVENEHFELIETLAEQIAAKLLASFAIAAVEIVVSKPHAPV